MAGACGGRGAARLAMTSGPAGLGAAARAGGERALAAAVALGPGRGKVLPGEIDAGLSDEAKLRGARSCTCCWNICRDTGRARTGPRWHRARSATRPAQRPRAGRGAAGDPGRPGLAALFARRRTGRGGGSRARSGGRRFLGTIDRLMVDARPGAGGRFQVEPACAATAAEDVPEGILRQMGAYAALLAQIYPDRRGRGGDPVDRPRPA